jgi:nucleobase:cation symporter-1, NCS1 family
VYRVAAGISGTYWVMGSSAIANGLSAGQAIAAMIIGTLISGAVCWGCGDFGVKYGLGFPMLSRATFGMYGSTFVVILKCFSNFI